MIGVWHPDWRERVYQYVREHGFDTVTAFADSQPTASTLALAAQLGDDVGASDIERILVDEAEEAGTMKRCAMSLIVRGLNQKLPEGWPAEWKNEYGGVDFHVSMAFVGIYTALPGPYRDMYDRAEDALLNAPIPPGWLPGSPDDPLLVRLFGDYWDTADDPEVKAERKARWLAERYEPMNARARELGFDSLTAYAGSRPDESLTELGYRLSTDFRDSDLARALVYEAAQAGSPARCARAILARALRTHLPQGWQRAWTTHPFGTGPRMVTCFRQLQDALGYRNDPVVEAIWDAIADTPPPEGWLPEGPDDPILVEAFARHWQDPAPDE